MPKSATGDNFTYLLARIFMATAETGRGGVVVKALRYKPAGSDSVIGIFQ